jgi:hypothetical protein
METSIKKSANASLTSVTKIFTAISFFIFSSVSRIIAQASDEPSVKNLRKTGAAVSEEVKKFQEKQAHDEFMSYVYMVIGFSIVIGIAWFSTVNARKRSKLENEEKLRLIQHNLAHKKHHDNHGHSTLHKARR